MRLVNKYSSDKEMENKEKEYFVARLKQAVVFKAFGGSIRAMYGFVGLLTLFALICRPTLATSVVNAREDKTYEPNWDSLDTRPLPAWYDDAKIGIFIHWGVFAVPSFGSEWFWSNWRDVHSEEYVEFMEKNYPPSFTYQEFAKDFAAEFFNATQWADIFANSGAKYVVLTSKHHEGFTLWPSEYSYSWNSVDIGPHRDIVGELSEAVRAKDMTFGTYHSLYEWFNPIYQSDKATNFAKQDFVFNKILPEMRELVNNYNISILWSDGDWEAPDTYWNSTEFLAWLYNESPVKDEVVVNDRWGSGIPCHHGDIYTCTDRYHPGTLQSHKWENAMTIDRKSWGFRRNAVLSDYLTIDELVSQLVSTVSCGGNLLMNIGPTSYGTISPVYEERLLQMGQWLAINGEAIYGTTPWTAQNDTLTQNVWYTSKDDTVYVTILRWNSYVVLGAAVEFFQKYSPSVLLLGNEDDGPLTWYVTETAADAVYIALPDKNGVKSEWGWVLKMQPNTTNVV